MDPEAVRRCKIFFKMSREYEHVLATRAQAKNDKYLRENLWKILNYILEEVRTANA